MYCASSLKLSSLKPCINHFRFPGSIPGKDDDQINKDHKVCLMRELAFQTPANSFLLSRLGCSFFSKGSLRAASCVRL